MKVKELIEELSKLDPELPVVVWDDDWLNYRDIDDYIAVDRTPTSVLCDDDGRNPTKKTYDQVVILGA